jgi:hypothetical protein
MSDLPAAAPDKKAPMAGSGREEKNKRNRAGTASPLSGGEHIRIISTRRASWRGKSMSKIP